MYKITIYLRTAVCFIDRPYLDGLLSYAVAREYLGAAASTGKLTLTDEEVKFIHDRIPVKRHPDGWFLASWMHWNEADHIEFTDSWKKRWDEKHDHLVDFGKKVRKVKINAGEFKSYNMPLTLHAIPEVWFYCESDDIEKVNYLLSKHVWGIGKKTAQGWGQISSIKYEEVEPLPWEQLRPIPMKKPILFNGSLRMMASRPPYWRKEHYEWCLMPESSN